MFDNIINFFKNAAKKEEKKQTQEHSKIAAKERLHLVLMQDRANVSSDFLELMKQELINVIKKYIDIDENEINVKLINQENEDGTNGAPAFYANIPIVNIKNEIRKMENAPIEKIDKAEEIKEKLEETKVQNEIIEEIVEEIKVETNDSDENIENSEAKKEDVQKQEVKKTETVKKQQTAGAKKKSTKKSNTKKASKK